MKNLIGISGKSQHGKDTVCKAIETAFPSMQYSTVRFADKVKDCVCLILGCTRGQLEDESFKSKILGEQWWYWKLIEENNYKELLLPYHAATGSEPYKLIQLTPRLLLQLLGTECGRKIIHPDIWVNATFVDYKPRVTKEDAGHNGEWFHVHHPEYSKWIIPDVRFPNEADRIKREGGILIRVERPDYISKINAMHESEIALDSYKDFDIIIRNEGSLDDFNLEICNHLTKLL